MKTVCRTRVAGFFIGNTAESILSEVSYSVLTLTTGRVYYTNCIIFIFIFIFKIKTVRLLRLQFQEWQDDLTVALEK